jgi:hypothetical protein
MNPCYETTSWRPGTLRAYESVGSIGAKYCYLNKVKPREFYNLILELIGEKNRYINRDDFTFDSLDFDFSKLSKLFNEPLPIVKKLSLKAINHLPNLRKQTGYSLASNEDFAYCPICLANGYHSPLHQISWVTNCFIHNEALINVVNKNKSIKNLHTDIKLLSNLYDIWFVESEIWESAKSYDWHLVDNKLIEEKAKLFIQALINTESAITNESTTIGNNIESKLLVLVENLGNSNSVFKAMHQNKSMRLGEPINFICSNMVADTLVKMNSKDFILFMYSRQITCESENAPEWKVALDKLPSILRINHKNCLHEYRKTFEQLEKTRISWCRWNTYVHPPYDMESYDRVPCQRIATLNLLQTILNFEDSLVHNSHGNFYDSRLGGMDYLFQDIEVLNDLITSDLAKKWVGFIVLGQHQIMKKYTPGYVFNTNDEADSRRTSMYVPHDLLEEIIDQLLLALVYVWIWALYETEMNRENLANQQFKPVQYLKLMISQLSPSAILEKTHNGLQLKIGTMVPYKTPDWFINKDDLINHYLNVQNKSRELEVTFDQVLLERMKSANLYQKSTNHLRIYSR